MLGRTANSLLFLAALAVASILGNCSKASAGYLPRSSSSPGDCLLTTESGPDYGAGGHDSSGAVTAPQTSEPPFSSPDQPEGPLAGRKLLTTYLGILNGRGNTSSGAGNPSHTNNGSGQPLAGSPSAAISVSPGPSHSLVDPDILPPQSFTSRLFRPPRL